MSDPHITYSDKELVELFHKGGKEFAFDIIVKQYQKRLYWHIRKLVIDHDDTDDVLQNTFIKIWNGLEVFRGDSQLFTWLYRIATNEALSFLQRKKKRTIIPLFTEEYDLSETLEGDPYFNADETQKRLQLAILSLPEKQRVVFNLKYFEEMKYEDMAEILNTSVGALKASFHHAAKKVEDYLKNTD